MSRKITVVVACNVVILLLFSVFDASEWFTLNQNTELNIESGWSPIVITLNSAGTPFDVMVIPNFSFILCCLAIVLNTIILLNINKKDSE